MSATTGFMTSYKQQSSGKERKILKKSEKSKNAVKKTFGLCTAIYVCVCVCVYVDYIWIYCVWWRYIHHMANLMLSPGYMSRDV